MEWSGSCHCGAIGFRYCTDQAPGAWSVRACQCSFCRAHQALSTSDPDATIEFSENRPGTLVRYRFGQRSADFLVCANCGVYIGVEMQSQGGKFGIINVNALRPIPAGLRVAEPKDYGQETLQQRITRREALWSKVRA